MEDVIPNVIDRGTEPFVKPFMVALSDDHFELDIRARGDFCIGDQRIRYARRYRRLRNI
ncbi:hypothetical protein [Nitrosospira sp. Nsp2]|uniref:hypothetical protein n=1 Tax=Nitrosospira sp. Nsp2 TaxID=136548 RepID=UPI0015E7A018|nr:hypothetical protein [Nitrosospira sp. Nsp2]